MVVKNRQTISFGLSSERNTSRPLSLSFLLTGVYPVSLIKNKVTRKLTISSTAVTINTVRNPTQSASRPPSIGPRITPPI
nr:hypothetical protein EP46_10205 [Pantoea sp. 3.5.1]